jgi:hypothetical protein
MSNLFEDAINTEAIEALDEATLDKLLAILTKAGY